MNYNNLKILVLKFVGDDNEHQFDIVDFDFTVTPLHGNIAYIGTQPFFKLTTCNYEITISDDLSEIDLKDLEKIYVIYNNGFISKTITQQHIVSMGILNNHTLSIDVME